MVLNSVCNRFGCFVAHHVAEFRIVRDGLFLLLCQLLGGEDVAGSLFFFRNFFGRLVARFGRLVARARFVSDRVVFFPLRSLTFAFFSFARFGRRCRYDRLCRQWCRRLADERPAGCVLWDTEGLEDVWDW